MIIGVDFGNINSFPAIIDGMDERTKRGGMDVFLLPPEMFKLGIPSTFHFKKAKKLGERDVFSYGTAAVLAPPRVNRRNMLKRRLWQSEAIDGQNINYDDVIVGMLKHILDIANQELEDSGRKRCSRISLAYPVVFDRGKMEHLKELAERVVLKDGAKVKVVGMIQEPAAAALEYLGTLPVARAEKDVTVLVYDLGGGTFDAAIVTAHQNAEGVMTSYEVLDQEGVPHAGNEFTEAMLQLIIRKFQDIGVQVDTRAAAMDRLRRDAEQLKCALSNPDTKVVLYADDDGNEIEITRADLEAETEKLVTDTIEASKRLFDRCASKPTMIIMTGGQSQMPVIRTRLEAQFPEISTDNVIIYKPQQAIALGAARFADLNANVHVPDPPVKLRTGKMLGLANVRDEKNDRTYVSTLIPRNTQVPMAEPVVEVFHPTNPCTKHSIYLCEALRDDPDVYDDDHFTTIAKLTINFNTAIPARPNFEVVISIDNNNNIQFSARDPKGKFQTVSVAVQYLNR